MGEQATHPIRATKRSRDRLDIMKQTSGIYLMTRAQILDVIVEEAWQKRIKDGTIKE